MNKNRATYAQHSQKIKTTGRWGRVSNGAGEDILSIQKTVDDPSNLLNGCRWKANETEEDKLQGGTIRLENTLATWRWHILKLVPVL